MSNIDNVFGSIAAPMIKEWGQNVVYVGIADPGVYNPATGQVTQNENRVNVKAVLTELKADELNGIYQVQDVKLMIDPGQLPNVLLSTADYWEWPGLQGGTVRAKTVEVLTYRGDSAVFYSCVVRPQ